MIPIPPQALKLGAYALVLGACWLHGCHYGESQVKDDYLHYKSNVEAVGKLAQQNADIQAERQKEKAHASDLSYAKALSVLGSDIERLRRARSSADYLPPAPADTKCPEGWACFDRTLLQQAIRQLDEGVSGILAEGDSVRLRLSEAITWANRLN